jgi:uracil-DNA glycosylase family 4
MDYLTKLYLESIGVHHVPFKQPSAGSPELATSDQASSDQAPIPQSRTPQVRAETSELDILRTELGDCTRCGLASDRKKIVFGVGDPGAQVVFVGEAPGRDEDLQGEPFVGKAGQLLTRIINAMGLERDQVYICNVIKCRPPGNRDPQADEIATCQPFLTKQLEIIRPRAICALGSFAARTLLNSDTGISRLRGQFHDYHGVPLMPTYHPSYLLRNPQAKREVWEDIQKIMELLGLPVKGNGGA